MASAVATAPTKPMKAFPLSAVQAQQKGMPGNLTKEQEKALRNFQEKVTQTEKIRARGEAAELLHLKWLRATDVSHVNCEHHTELIHD